MILVIEILGVLMLATILLTLFLDERNGRLESMHKVKLKGYWEGPERRSVERFDITLDVRYFMDGGSAGTKSVDISTKGIRLLLDEKLEKGMPIKMEIKLPSQTDIIKVQGDIVWTEESPEDEKDSEKRMFNTGIKFTNLHSAEEKKLFDFLHGKTQSTHPRKVDSRVVI